MFESAVMSAASRHPKVDAYADDKGSLSYAQMASDIAQCAAWLKLKGVRPGERVMLHLASVYRHWVLFFALEAVGAISVATWDGKPVSDKLLSMVGADRYLTSLAPEGALARPGLTLDRGWLTGVRKMKLAPLRERPRSPQDPICVAFSSGTTGLPKKILLRRADLDRRVYAQESLDFWPQGTRLLMLFPVGTAGSLIVSLRTFAYGVTLCDKRHDLDFPRALDVIRPTLICGAPIHLDQALRALGPDFKADPPIHIAVGGGSITAALADEVRRRFGGRLSTFYGSTELGFVARHDIGDNHDDRRVGPLLPDMEVEIRDPDGRPLPSGEIGEVWIRSPQVIDGYLEETGPTSSSFRDGWFHPGDLGSFDAEGILSIHGRTDDVMNFQGFKTLPSTVEAAVRRLGLVRDVAVFSAPPPGETQPAPWVVCVADQPVPSDRIAPAVPRTGAFMLGFVDVIPRNAMGKIDRLVLRERATTGALAAERIGHAR